MAPKASVGRQSAQGGVYANGGVDSSLGIAAKASVGRQSSVDGRANGGINSQIGSKAIKSPDAARFGNNEVAAVGRTGLAASLAASQGATIGRQSSVGGIYANGGTNSFQARALTAAYNKDVTKVTKAGAGWTQVELRDGTIETRKGTRASRNNNPGNVEYGPYAKSMGAVGTDGRFAVFSTKEQGLKAIGGLVFNSPKYAGATIRQAIGIYAPEFENDTNAYAATVAKATGATVNTKVSDLSPEQRTALIGGITRVEGGKPYSTTTQKAGRVSNTVAVSAAQAPALTTTRIPVPTPTARPAAAPTRFAEKYLGNVPTPTARPAPTRSLPDKVLAGAIDVGVGMIPGIGTAAGLYGLAAPLVGLPTVGDMALSLRDKNQFDLTASLKNQRESGGGSGNDGVVKRLKPTTPPKAAEPAIETATFEEKYLNYRDPTPRPTPEQKWGPMGASSVAYSL